MNKNIKNIHFMGIGGSGMAGVAELASKSGYQVSGCDLEKKTFYLSQLEDKIKVFYGHSTKHLKNVDALVITPAVIFQNIRSPEYIEGKDKKIVFTWLKGQLMRHLQVVIQFSSWGFPSLTPTIFALSLLVYNPDDYG
jgi:UDP-N-acetylmuramate--alanine ligase